LGESEILNEKSNFVFAQTRVIVSASRSRKKATFYSDWFLGRWKTSYVKWKNSFVAQTRSRENVY